MLLNLVVAMLEIAPPLGGALLSAVRALADAAPTPLDATTVEGAKSNSSDKTSGRVEEPVLLATTVKGSKSNSPERGGGIRAVAAHVQADVASAPLVRVARGEVEGAPGRPGAI